METSLNLPFLLFIFLSIGCNKTSSPEEIFANTSQKYIDNKTISYDYHNEINYVPNEMVFSDTAKISYYKIDSSYLGFGLYANHKNDEYLFDGFYSEKLDHSKKTRIIFNKNEVKEDSTYISDLPFFFFNPINIQNQVDFDSVYSININDRNFNVFRFEKQNKSKSDSTKIVRYQTFYFIPTDVNQVSQVQEIIIREQDTLQIAKHYFSNYNFQKTQFNKSDYDYFKNLDYTSIKAEDEDEEEDLNWTPIKVDEKLVTKTFTDVNEEKVDLYGDSQKTTLVMFSFIGCAPCEGALKDFKDQGYNLKKEYNLYYSSFQNTSSALKKYLKKKEFPFRAFGKESKMIEDFYLATAPTFVLISSDGTILKILEGYDDETKNVLFDILLERLKN